MNDTIIKGTGNSRSLRSVANLAALAPTYEDFLAMLAAGTLPIDIGQLNPTGVTQEGTPLDKASLLTDSLCTALGLATSATPTQAMEKLRQLVSTAQGTADVKPNYQVVSYVGTGTSGAENPCSLTFSFAPKFILWLGRSYGTQFDAASYGGGTYVHNGIVVLSTLSTSYRQYQGFARGYGMSYAYAKRSADQKTIYWYNAYTSTSDAAYGIQSQLNTSGYTYFFCAFG